MINYFGSFPPPYGGVTVKNNLLFDNLKELLGDALIKVDTQQAKKNPLLLLRQGALLLLNQKDSFVIATAGTQRRRITLFLNKYNPGALHRSVLIVMGGHFAERIRDDAPYIQALGNYRRIFVETEAMIRELQNLGLKNAALYPNCRCRPTQTSPVVPNYEKLLRCLFFSLISIDKGADRVLEAARALPHVQFDFYGSVDPEYEETFRVKAEQIPNAAYHGVFQVNGENVYRKLNEYDVLLLPTAMPHEGVPGILVESKIAAIPAIVSNVCYNAEIIEDGISGIVLRENTVEALTEAIACYDRDRDLLRRHKEGALHSAEKYYVENYLDEIVKALES